VERAAAQRVMRHALALAALGRGRTSPNPMVGALVVKGGRVIGRGYHRRAGLPHAEVLALRQASRRARGATLIVTLEPCRHHGRTPPCCQAIEAAGIREVIIGARDPNPITRGRGVARLRRAGIRVSEGVLNAEARRLNAPFEHVMRTGMPLIVGKIAQSLDGKIATATGTSRWITAAPARRDAHALRRQADAIIVGIETILHDDPRLTARPAHPAGAQRPITVILDGRLRTPTAAACLSVRSPAPTLIATTATDAPRRRALEHAGAEVFVCRASHPGGRVPLKAVCQELVRRGIHSVLIEGGGEVLASAFEARLINRVAWYVAPVVIGGRNAPGAIGGEGIQRLADAVRLADVSVRRIGRDICIEGRVVYPRASASNRRVVRRRRALSPV